MADGLSGKGDPQEPAYTRAALKARTFVLSAVRAVRAVAAATQRQERASKQGSDWTALLGSLPLAKDLQSAFAALGGNELTDPVTSPLRRGALYGTVRGGFASRTLRPKLLRVGNTANDPIGKMIFDWMESQLREYEIKLSRIEYLDPRLAVNWCTVTIRDFVFLSTGTLTCDPENLDLHACRRPYPDDAEYISTVTAVGDFPRTIAQLARVYDPRKWDTNPYAEHFEDVHPVKNAAGTPDVRTEAIGTTWSAEPSWISEKVDDSSGTSFLVNTLDVEFAVTPTWLRFTYDLGKSIESSGTLSMERDFGYLNVDPVAGRPGWSRIHLEKNIRFSGNAGTTDGDIGWGDLANLIAPDYVAHWLLDMRYMPCWAAP